MSVDWSYFDRFERVLDEYMPARGEGETMASQIATAVNKLVYKWYNDGDVFDNTCTLAGWCNDLSSYANWLAKNGGKECKEVLERVYTAKTDDEYEEILKALADLMLDEELLGYFARFPVVGTIYNCDGDFEFVEREEEEEDEEEYEPWEEEEDGGEVF